MDPSKRDQAVLRQPRLTTPPRWVAALADECPAKFSLLSAQIADAAAMPSGAFTEAVTEQYRRIVASLHGLRLHAVRIWNYVPRIQASALGGNRYMAFNAGRFAVFADWFGNVDDFAREMPTASAVGTSGSSLWIHVLASTCAGIPVENPRQIPSYRYSRRYGARPPCFARATKLGDALFIGGTASIVGEDSHHLGDVTVQTRETLRNLAAVIASATDLPESDALRALRDVRVHISEPQHAERVAQILEKALPESIEMEFVEAQLCRRELLVEIEGRASCA